MIPVEGVLGHCSSTPKNEGIPETTDEKYCSVVAEYLIKSSLKQKYETFCGFSLSNVTLPQSIDSADMKSCFEYHTPG